jgi:hypothetical protein
MMSKELEISGLWYSERRQNGMLDNVNMVWFYPQRPPLIFSITRLWTQYRVLAQELSLGSQILVISHKQILKSGEEAVLMFCFRG